MVSEVVEMATGQPYTLGMWRVKAGHEEEFVAAWEALGQRFAALPHPPVGAGTLLQAIDDPTLFYSFGPWARLEDIAEMRADPETRTAIGALVALCEEGRPGTFTLRAMAG